MPKMVCVTCQVEFRIQTNGVAVVEMMNQGPDPAVPYKVWEADLWACPGCHQEVVAGCGTKPVREDHWAPDFAEWLARYLVAAPRAIYDFERLSDRPHV